MGTDPVYASSAAYWLESYKDNSCESSLGKDVGAGLGLQPVQPGGVRHMLISYSYQPQGVMQHHLLASQTV